LRRETSRASKRWLRKSPVRAPCKKSPGRLREQRIEVSRGVTPSATDVQRCCGSRSRRNGHRSTRDVRARVAPRQQRRHSREFLPRGGGDELGTNHGLLPGVLGSRRPTGHANRAGFFRARGPLPPLAVCGAQRASQFQPFLHSSGSLDDVMRRATKSCGWGGQTSRRPADGMPRGIYRSYT